MRTRKGFHKRFGVYGWTAYDGRRKLSGPYEYEEQAEDALDRARNPQPVQKLVLRRPAYEND